MADRCIASYPFIFVPLRFCGVLQSSEVSRELKKFKEMSLKKTSSVVNTKILKIPLLYFIILKKESTDKGLDSSS